MFQRRITHVCASAIALPWLCGACSLLFSTSDEQCATDADCRQRGAMFASSRCSTDNVCVGAASTTDLDASTESDAGADGAEDPFACANIPAPTPDPTRQVDLTIRYTDFSTGSAPSDTVVRLCAATDTSCDHARTTLVGSGPGDAGPEGGLGFVVPNADGTVTAKVEFGFEGFFEVRSNTYAPTFRSTSPPLRRPKTELEQLLLRPKEIHFLADSALGRSDAYDDVGHGLVFVMARDCNQQPLGGVSFTTSASDPKMQLFYIINSAPSISDTKTDSLGRGGFVNMPPGFHTFTATFADTGKRIGSGHTLVRAGAATTIAIEPSP
ncbi:hypothetical protein AKJ09_10216 [Labilithrix luteola]|uniref:Lipoprotein n=1 Tax=Labilithrix luteola TaxID=1391654 RepID=A0A0K1QCU7_9BACT|nr:hypothetical protein [Labilithrix luteola]AKV03553.1 hypothetical protein AKJ09_10216 [Labilithrix luteola]